MKLGKTGLITLLLALPALALAAVLTVTWTHPSQNTDNTAIPATGPGSIASTRVEYGTCAPGSTPAAPVFGSKSGEVVVTGQAQTTPLPNLGPGTYCGRAFTTNTYGEESAASNVAQKTINAPVPKPPTNFSLG